MKHIYMYETNLFNPSLNKSCAIYGTSREEIKKTFKDFHQLKVLKRLNQSTTAELFHHKCEDQIPLLKEYLQKQTLIFKD